MHTFKKLDAGEMAPSEIIREHELLLKGDNVCAYCEQVHSDLQLEHVIPKGRGGPDTADNTVLACRGCNLSKGSTDLFRWYQKSDEIPRLVLGKYLKLVFEHHQQAGTLDAEDVNADGTLDVFDLGAAFVRK